VQEPKPKLESKPEPKAEPAKEEEVDPYEEEVDYEAEDDDDVLGALLGAARVSRRFLRRPPRCGGT
jgi:hypothetical protein